MDEELLRLWGPNYKRLKPLYEELINDKKLALLDTVNGQNKIVFGRGHGRRILIVGEAPGRQEALEGAPFVGPSGKMIESLLQENGIKNTEVFITNCVRIRPTPILCNKYGQHKTPEVERPEYRDISRAVEQEKQRYDFAFKRSKYSEVKGSDGERFFEKDVRPKALVVHNHMKHLRKLILSLQPDIILTFGSIATNLFYSNFNFEELMGCEERFVMPDEELGIKYSLYNVQGQGKPCFIPGMNRSAWVVPFYHPSFLLQRRSKPNAEWLEQKWRTAFKTALFEYSRKPHLEIQTWMKLDDIKAGLTEQMKREGIEWTTHKNVNFIRPKPLTLREIKEQPTIQMQCNEVEYDERQNVFFAFGRNDHGDSVCARIEDFKFNFYMDLPKDMQKLAEKIRHTENLLYRIPAATRNRTESELSLLYQIKKRVQQTIESDKNVLQSKVINFEYKINSTIQEKLNEYKQNDGSIRPGEEDVISPTEVAEIEEECRTQRTIDNSVTIKLVRKKPSDTYLNNFETYPFVLEVCANSYKQIKSIVRTIKETSEEPTLSEYQTDLNAVPQFTYDLKTRMCGWIEFPLEKIWDLNVRNFPEDIEPGRDYDVENVDMKTTCDVEFTVKCYDMIPHDPLDNNNRQWARAAPLRDVFMDIEMLGKDGKFPRPNHSPIICISAIVQENNEKTVIDKDTNMCNQSKCYIFTMRACSKMEGDELYMFNDEAEMLTTFLKFVVQMDPDNLWGHNLKRFDLRCIVERLRILGMKRKDGFRAFGRMKSIITEITEKKFQSRAFGERILVEVPMFGRANIDSLEMYMREKKLASYTLESLAKKFLGIGKNDMPHTSIPGYFWGSPEDNKLLNEYCKKDSLIVYFLKNKHLLEPGITESCRVNGTVSINGHNVKGQQLRVFSGFKHTIQKYDPDVIVRTQVKPGGFALTPVEEDMVVENYRIHGQVGFADEDYASDSDSDGENIFDSDDEMETVGDVSDSDEEMSEEEDDSCCSKKDKNPPELLERGCVSVKKPNVDSFFTDKPTNEVKYKQANLNVFSKSKSKGTEYVVPSLPPAIPTDDIESKEIKTILADTEKRLKEFSCVASIRSENVAKTIKRINSICQQLKLFDKKQLRPQQLEKFHKKQDQLVTCLKQLEKFIWSDIKDEILSVEDRKKYKGAKTVGDVKNIKDIRRKKIELSAKLRALAKTIKGATVFETLAGLHIIPIICCDFASLYPSLMICYNISHELKVFARDLAKRFLHTDDVYKVPIQSVHPDDAKKFDPEDPNSIDERKKYAEDYYFVTQRYKRTVYETDVERLGFVIGETVKPRKNEETKEEEFRVHPIKAYLKEQIEEGKFNHIFTGLFDLSKEESLAKLYELLEFDVAERLYLIEDEDAGKGLIPLTLDVFLKARGAAKSARNDYAMGTPEYNIYEGRQNAFKIIANSTFGSTSVKRGTGKLADPDLGGAVTSFGRFHITDMRDKANEKYKDPNSCWVKGIPMEMLHNLSYGPRFQNGQVDISTPIAMSKAQQQFVDDCKAAFKKYLNVGDTKCVGGDTDSFFQGFAFCRTVEEAMEFGYRLVQFLNKFLKPPMKLEFEKVMNPLLSIAKKRYAGNLFSAEENGDFFEKKRWIELNVDPKEWISIFTRRKPSEEAEFPSIQAMYSKYPQWKEEAGHGKIESYTVDPETGKVKAIILGDLNWFVNGVYKTKAEWYGYKDPKTKEWVKGCIAVERERRKNQTDEEWLADFLRPRYANKEYLPSNYGRLFSKGLETVRRDSCPFLSTTMDLFFRMILIEGRVKEAFMYVYDRISDLMDGKIPSVELICSKKISKEFYKNAEQPHTYLQKKIRDNADLYQLPVPELGDRVPFFITKTKKGDKKYQKAEHPKIVYSQDIPIDYECYVVDKCIKPLVRVMQHFIIDAENVMFDLPEMSRKHSTAVIADNKVMFGNVTYNMLKKNRVCVICEESGFVTKNTEIICKSCLEQSSSKFLERKLQDSVEEYRAKFGDFNTYLNNVCRPCSNTKDAHCDNYQNCNYMEARMDKKYAADVAKKEVFELQEVISEELRRRGEKELSLVSYSSTEVFCTKEKIRDIEDLIVTSEIVPGKEKRIWKSRPAQNRHRNLLSQLQELQLTKSDTLTGQKRKVRPSDDDPERVGPLTKMAKKSQ